MEEKQIKVVHVHFKETGIDDYLGSLSVLYDYYSKDDIGYTLRSLQSLKIAEGIPFENDKIRINIARLKRKKK